MHEVDRQLGKRLEDFLDEIKSLNLNFIICAKSKKGSQRFMIAANVPAEEAMCTLGNAIPLLFHPEWPGLPWDICSINLVKQLANALMKQVDLLTSEFMICFSLKGNASPGGYIAYAGGIADALDCVYAITQQMVSLLKMRFSQ